MAEIELFKDYVPLSELAKELNKHPRTIERWGLPFAQVGNQKMIHIPSAREALAARVRKHAKGA